MRDWKLILTQIYTTKTIKVIFSPDSVPKDKNEIHFEHDFGKSLQFYWLSTDGETWELQASLKLDETKIPDESVAVMTFSDTKLPKITLPVYVMLNEEEQP